MPRAARVEDDGMPERRAAEIADLKDQLDGEAVAFGSSRLGHALTVHGHGLTARQPRLFAHWTWMTDFRNSF
jgi:hypothetical protein